MDGAVELAKLIDQLRDELTAASKAGAGKDFQFEVGPVELELTVAVTKDAGGSGKVRFWVVELGADAKLSAATTQRIKLTLDPRRAGEPDRRPLISGRDEGDER